MESKSDYFISALNCISCLVLPRRLITSYFFELIISHDYCFNSSCSNNRNILFFNNIPLILSSMVAHLYYVIYMKQIFNNIIIAYRIVHRCASDC